MPRYRRQNGSEIDEDKKSVQDGVNVLADAGMNAFNIMFSILRSILYRGYLLW